MPVNGYVGISCSLLLLIQGDIFADKSRAVTYPAVSKDGTNSCTSKPTLVAVGALRVTLPDNAMTKAGIDLHPFDKGEA
jgi:hypothetical protein